MVPMHLAPMAPLHLAEQIRALSATRFSWRAAVLRLRQGPRLPRVNCHVPRVNCHPRARAEIDAVGTKRFDRSVGLHCTPAAIVASAFGRRQAVGYAIDPCPPLSRRPRVSYGS
jgi:hypothetical protein